MKKKRKIVLILAFLTAIVIVVSLGFMKLVNITSPPNKDKADDIFKKDKSDIMLITEYLIGSEYLEIDINKNNFSREKPGMFTGIETNYKCVKDEAVVEAIYRLFNNQGYSSIGRNDNTISFLRWTRLMDFGSGIAYSINGKDEPVLQFLTKIEPLTENQWYYYEEDYNQWRLQNQS